MTTDGLRKKASPEKAANDVKTTQGVSIMKLKALILSCAAAALLAGPAHAQLTLTPQGIADGFTLTSFVSGYNFGATYGPLAEGILPDGNVITGSMGDGKIYIFKDVNGQTLASAVSATSYSFTTGNPNYAMATAGGQVYGAQLFGGVYEHFTTTGAHTAIAGLAAADYLGMWGDPVNGHIIASSYQGLIDINPLTATFRMIAANPGADGVSISPDGSIVYAEAGGNILAYSYTSGALLHTYSGGGNSPDGTGVISGGKFNGDVVVNNNNGTVGLIDVTSGTETIIASGGNRGDFVSPDTSNGTLFLSQFNQVWRLSCGTGCSIGTSAPEPGTLVLLGLGLAGLAARRRLRA
jgi:hypothetical protein